MPGQSVQSGEFLPATFTFKRPQTLMQQHVPLAIVLSSKPDDRLGTPVIQAFVRSLVVV